MSPLPSPGYIYLSTTRTTGSGRAFTTLWAWSLIPSTMWPLPPTWAGEWVGRARGGGVAFDRATTLWVWPLIPSMMWPLAPTWAGEWVGVARGGWHQTNPTLAPQNVGVVNGHRGVASTYSLIWHGFWTSLSKGLLYLIHLNLHDCVCVTENKHYNICMYLSVDRITCWLWAPQRTSTSYRWFQLGKLGLGPAIYRKEGYPFLGSKKLQWNLEMWTPLGPIESVLIREVS